MTSKPTKPPRKRAAPLRSRPAAKRSVKTSKSAPVPYHHGALREALLAAAERVLERDGLPGLTLRAAAREAGVSHAAPTHHFGDLTGLVSELAATGFRHFNAAMADAAEIDGPPLLKAAARARAYLAYARAHPAMYLLMFRTERLDMTRPALREAANAAFAGIAGAIGSIRGEAVPAQTLSLDQAAEIVRAWSLVHGYTMLLIDGRLTDIIERLPAGTDAETLFGAMLMSMGRPPG
uniref:Putative transcriptional regulator, TetR family n=1 Tax=Rhodopseudomonas palustris (strain BisA53) TaxID=316055 RepID=Q07RA8_RHOP5